METKKINKKKMTIEDLAAMFARQTTLLASKEDLEPIKVDLKLIVNRLDRIDSRRDDISEILDNHEKDILKLKHKVVVLGRRQA